jgi:hypothetical protein
MECTVGIGRLLLYSMYRRRILRTFHIAVDF